MLPGLSRRIGGGRAAAAWPAGDASAGLSKGPGGRLEFGHGGLGRGFDGTRAASYSFSPIPRAAGRFGDLGLELLQFVELDFRLISALTSLT